MSLFLTQKGGSTRNQRWGASALLGGAPRGYRKSARGRRSARLPHAPAALAPKGLSAASRLIVACQRGLKVALLLISLRKRLPPLGAGDSALRWGCHAAGLQDHRGAGCA